MSRPNPRSVTLEEAQECVLSIFTDPGEDDDVIRLQPSPEEKPDVLIDGMVFQFPMMVAGQTTEIAGGQAVWLRLFVGLGELAKNLWTQEVRTLIRFSGGKHPALPLIRDGGTRHWSGWADGVTRIVGFVVTERWPHTFEEFPAKRLREYPLEAVRHLRQLADALGILHSNALMHRNLWRGTVEAGTRLRADGTQASGLGSIQLRLARFEMSTLQTNVLWRSVRKPKDEWDATALEFRKRFLSQGPLALATVPLERLRALFPDGALREIPEQPRGDVYSLGVLAFEWFVADIEAEILDAAFPQVESDADGLPSYGFSLEGWGRFHAWLHEKIGSMPARELPAELKELLRSMLSRNPRNRPTAWAVVAALQEDYEAIAARVEQNGGDPKMLVAFAPREYQHFREWGWIGNDPATSEGLAELQQFLQRDLRGGVLEYSQRGYADIGGQNRTFHSKAKFVLRGRRGAYFCHVYEYRAPWEEEGQGESLPQVMMIRATLDLSAPQARGYSPSPFRRRLPSVELLPFDSPRLKPQVVRNLRPWTPWMQTVEHQVHAPPEQESISSALSFLLDLSQAEIDARQYAFERIPGESGNVVRLRFDKDRDERRLLKQPLLALYGNSDDRRPPFADFFDSLEDWGFRNVVRWKADRGGEPSGDWTLLGRGEVDDRMGIDQILIRCFEGQPDVPTRGWLEPDDDQFARVVLRRQRAARNELKDRPLLLRQLAHPQSMIRPGNPWHDASAAFEVRRGGDEFSIEELKGDRSREVLLQLLDCWPIYALQGPPGTGKTTIAARAIRATLKRDNSQRILVAAQSHDSLDHLMAEILSCFSDNEVLPIRIAPEGPSRDRVAQPMQRYRPDILAPTRVSQLRAHAARLTKGELPHFGAADPLAVAKLLHRWIDYLDKDENGAAMEIQDRIRRGSNLVFATCATCTEDNVGVPGSSTEYDWVIVEEAAKAWPTELIMPLVRGNRWALLGDQKQLGAYRYREVIEILDECRKSPSETLQRDGRSSEEYDRVFRMFAHFFRRNGGKSEDDNEVALMPSKNSSEAGSLMRQPTGRLNVQFRMRDPIGLLVSEVFYGKKALKTARSTKDHVHGLLKPNFLDQQALVWIDTSPDTECFEVPCWRNEGEVAILQQLLESMQPSPLAGEHKRKARLAILTPYRAQVDALRAKLPTIYREHIHTVDSFQGDQADIIIASLVRGGGKRHRRVTSALGHLVSEQRINVMMSRARALLILIGKMSHFESAVEEGDSRGAFWGKLCRFVRSHGLIIDAARAFGSDRGAQ